MKKHTFKRCAAIFAAVATMLTALPMTQITVSAAALISNGTFEGSTSGWGMYKESGGSATLSSENGKLALKISNTGKVTYAVQMFYDIIPLYQNGVYHLKYDISCTTDRFVEGMIQQNGGTYQAYTWKGLNLTSQPQTVDYEFTMEADTDIMAKLVFNCGLQESDGENLPEHTIYLDNVSLELVDDSRVDYSASRPYAPDILTNQVGYPSNSKKTAVFRNVTNETEFSVVNADTNQIVYTGGLSSAINNSSANETDYVGDFSNVTQSGNYYIQCGNLDKSYPFTISENPYSSMLDDSIKMLYLQRCGTTVQDAVFAHGACHNTMATIYGTNEQIDVSGGWHDAGDYGRYTVAGAKAVADLLYAYLTNPSVYSDNIGIPESGNGRADILDEAKWELDWMLKMQANNGGVYHKVTCENFPAYVAPEKETAPLIVTPISTTATADFAGAMALAAEVYKDSDSAFAEKCLNAAKNAWNFLQQNPNLIFENPQDITTGEYGDKSDTDERYWAAAQLYRATNDGQYLSALEGMAVQTGLDWALVGDYGNIALLTAKGIDKNSSAYTKAKNAILKQADKFLSNSNASAYGVSQTTYNWGSNMTIANSGITLGLAYQLTGDAKYQEAAQAQLNYLLGTNPLGTSFMTGYGTVSPENPHHRPSMAAGQAMKGMLVGGVNSNLEDSAAKAYCNGLAPALCYVDNSESYSTNEITIYWNSPLTYLLVVTAEDAPQNIEEPTQPIETTEPSSEPVEQPTQPTQPTTPTGNTVYGDVDCNGIVDIADVLTLNQHLLGIVDISTQGRVNADVDNNNAVSDTDALNILKSLVDLVTLPIGGNAPVIDPVQPFEPTTEPTTSNTGMNANATAVADFRQGSSSLFFASDGWTNGSCFDCWWYKENTSLDNGCLSLTIDKDRDNKGMYSGAEYRTVNFYQYGYYETSMQAIKNNGVVSSFFTYTGPSDNNPWDEIDIEILGKDTTKVQFNYYTNGVGNHEYMYDLGFDASEGFHTYGFDWQPDHITWYVDGKAVYTANDNIPSTAGKIMMNVWPGTGVDDWLNPFDGTTPLTARYQWVTYNHQ
ncbi:MAG: glycoside hydrolase family 9 protein [Oscillospiraceae bacterium]